MRKLLLSTCLLASLSPAATLSAFAMPAIASPADSSLLTEKFSVSGNTSVPGTTLKAGSYVIRVVDHMSDRSILRIEREDGKVVTTFLGVPNRQLAGNSGPVTWEGGNAGAKALKGFNFPGSYSVEFVYPKAEAVKIAVAHSAAVEAIDPSSDNLPSKEQKLTDDDMRIVTLWTLSPTRVNGTTAIAAEKFKPAAEPAPPAPVVARNDPPPAPGAPRPGIAPLDPPRPPAPVRPASQMRTPAPAPKPPARRPVASALPHTASNLPAALLAGTVALFGIVLLRSRRFLVGM